MINKYVCSNKQLFWMNKWVVWTDQWIRDRTQLLRAILRIWWWSVDWPERGIEVSRWRHSLMCTVAVWLCYVTVYRKESSVCPGSLLPTEQRPYCWHVCRIYWYATCMTRRAFVVVWPEQLCSQIAPLLLTKFCISRSRVLRHVIFVAR